MLFALPTTKKKYWTVVTHTLSNRNSDRNTAMKSWTCCSPTCESVCTSRRQVSLKKKDVIPSSGGIPAVGTEVGDEVVGSCVGPRVGDAEGGEVVGAWVGAQVHLSGMASQQGVARLD